MTTKFAIGQKYTVDFGYGVVTTWEVVGRTAKTIHLVDPTIGVVEKVRVLFADSVLANREVIQPSKRNEHRIYARSV